MLEYTLDGKVSIASKEITIENSTFCGAKCIMCPRDEYDKKWSHMDTDLFVKTVDQAVKLGVKSLDLCGFGDTFLDPGLAKKLKIVKEKYPSLIVYTSTTAHAIQGKNLDTVAKYFDTIRISNCGFSKKSYEEIHAGKLEYEKVMKNIDALLSLPNDTRPYIMMTFLIFPENEHEIEEWKSYWVDKVDEIAIWRPHNFGGSGVDEIAFKSYERLNNEKMTSCGRPFKGNPYVRSNGDISVCCFDFNQKLTVGNLKFLDLQDILSGHHLKEIQDIHTKKDFLSCNKICNGCDQIYSRKDALVFASNDIRKVYQPNNHPDHIIQLRNSY